MQVLCDLQPLFSLFKCQTPVNEDKSKLSKKISLFAFSICAVVCLICMKWYTEMACMLCITLAELSMLMLIGVFIGKIIRLYNGKI